MRFSLNNLFIICLFICFGAGACGNNAPTASIPLDTPSGINALTIPEQVSYITPQETIASASTNSFLGNISKFAVPTAGEYLTDETEYYVYEESMQALDTMNIILCSLKQARSDSMINEGAYAALINYDVCDRNSSQASSSTNQSTGKPINYERWILNSTRASDTADQVINIWVENTSTTTHGSEDPTSDLDEIKAKMTITEEASDDNPLGSFHMDLAGYDSNGLAALTGFIVATTNDSGETTLQMTLSNPYMTEPSYQTVNALLNPSADSGKAYSYETAADFVRTSYVAFDSNYYRSKVDSVDGSDTKTSNNCLDRQNYTSSVWQYNLYDSDGAKVDLNGGFSVTQGTDIYGYASYYGIWLSDDTEVTSGMTLAGTDQNYTTLVGGGRLTKITSSTSTLASIKDETFMYWDYIGDSYWVKWNGTDFVATAYESCGDDGCTTIAMSETPLIFYTDEWISLWKQSFGSVTVIVPYEGLSDATSITYDIETLVTPDDYSSPFTLYCYYQCPKGALSASDLNDETPFLDTVYDFIYGSEIYYTYTFDPSDYSLTYNGDEVTIASGAVIDSGSYYYWGLASGDLVTSALEDSWDVWDAEITYQWETGPESWNKYTALIDSNGDVVEFDEPLVCTYTHSTYGTYYLEYAGVGELWGIPYELNEDTSSNFEHWSSLFAIPNGTEISCNGTTYYTKAMVVEEYMTSLDSSSCSSLALPTDLTTPENQYTEPDIGTKPSVDDPSVIGGVVQ